DKEKLTMTKCNKTSLELPARKGRKVEISFEGGKISSDGGILLLSQVDRKLGLTQKVAKHFPDQRDQSKITHNLLSMLRQRVYGLALGYEDLNDHNELRHDPAFQTAVNKDVDLASSPTLCRLENTADRQSAVATHQILIEQFINSYKSVPKEIILDFDATDDI